MAQHDYIISNQTFPNTRTDINNLASAIATNNSGTSAPTTQYAGQFWIDTTTTTWTLYIHDGTDDIQFATIDTSANTVNFTDSALDVVTDTTPQLGGNLDLNSSDITGTGNINITGTVTATSFSGDGSSLTGVASDVVDDTTPQLGGNLDTNGNDINFGDNDKAQFGASNDLQIYHDGSDSYIDDVGAGNLIVKAGSLRIKASNDESMIDGNANGAVNLYYDNSKKFETTSTGATITGSQLLSSPGSSVFTYFDSTSNYIGRDSSTGNMEFGVNGSDRMLIDSSGTVMISTANTNPVSSGGTGASFRANGQLSASQSADYVIQVNRDSDGGIVHILRSSGVVGSISVTSSSTAYNTSSDYRLKENVVEMTGATDRLKQLSPKRFNFIADADTTVDGFLAHEVQSVVPEAITGTHNEVEVWEEGEELPEGVSIGDNKLDDEGNTIPKYQGIDQSKLVPVLVASLKEALTEIDNLKARVDTLEGN